MMLDADPLLFALSPTRPFAERVSAALGLPLAALEERDFEDGEHKSRPLVSVRERDVFVAQSLYSDADQSVDDKLTRLLFFIAALKDAGAGRVTAVVPYLAYARKDRKTQPRDPVTSRYVAALFEAVGTDVVVTLDVHNLAAYQNAFRCRTEHLTGQGLFVDHLAPILGGRDVTVLSPDVGGVKRAEQFRHRVERALDRSVAAGFMEKGRARGVVTGDTLVGEVTGRVVIIIDDLISTGTTLLRAAQACRAAGAQSVHCAASHGLFTDHANRMLADPAIDRVIVTDTVPPRRVTPALCDAKLVLVDAAPLFAEAIRRLHSGGSLVELLG
jgi:ribose-phosphate pyrophosphokinase